MAIFNSYVKLPEGKYGELIHLLTVTDWDEPPSMDDMHELPKTVEMKKTHGFRVRIYDL